MAWVVLSEVADLERVNAVGRRLARALEGGDVVLLRGPLGAGKTALVRAAARGLEVTDPVRSPSFTIANVYQGSLTVNHLDLYRLEDIGSEDVLALEEYVREDAVTLVEWPDAGQGEFASPAFVVRLDHESPDLRSIVVEAHSASARDRWESAGEKTP